MIIDILTLFPEMFEGVLNSSIIKRAIDKNVVTINIHDFRTYSNNKHKKVDDTPYGGGAGMLLTLQPIVDCLKAINYKEAKVLLTTPSGSTYNQEKAKSLSEENRIIIICGHYEGIDARIENYIDEEVSIGDFVLTGGEIASLAILDSVIRLLPEAINASSIEDESFSYNLLEYPQYTKPASFDGFDVPSQLVNGNHEEIRKFRRYTSLKKTFSLRPDLLDKVMLTKEDKMFLNEISKSIK